MSLPPRPRRAPRLPPYALIINAALAGCGGEPLVAAGGGALRGGSDALQDDAVVALQITARDGRRGLCSAALIAPRVALTAAHCVAPSSVGAGARFALLVGAEVGAATPAEVAWVRHDAAFDAGLLQRGRDVGVVVAAAPLGAPRLPWRAAALPELGGVRVVGYGAVGASAVGSGQRRTAWVPVRAERGGVLEVGDEQAGPCVGDSGGPALARLAPAEGEVIVGVVSSGSEACGGTAAVSTLGASAGQIGAWLEEAEAPAGCQVSPRGGSPWAGLLVVLLWVGRRRGGDLRSG